MRKMKRTGQHYTPELRAEAVRLVLEHGMTQAEVAQRLSVPKGTIANWVYGLPPEVQGSFEPISATRFASMYPAC